MSFRSYAFFFLLRRRPNLLSGIGEFSVQLSFYLA